MRTTTLPPIRVDPELRAEAERLLEDNETLSAMMQQALRRELHRRTAEREFLARGLASADKARKTGEYVLAEQVLADLESILAETEEQTSSR